MTDSTQLTSREVLDIIIQRTILIYRWAVYVSFAIIAIGFVLAIAGDQDVSAEMAMPINLLRQIFDLQASGYLGVGIGVMILTPIVMIADGAISFFRAGDRRYGLITIGVAIILSLSIAISFVTG